MTRQAYHWTHKGNLDSIITNGVDPAFSEGKMLASWFCGPSRVGWALCHVAARHGWDPDEMICLRLEVNPSTLKRTCNADVWTASALTPPSAITGVKYHHWEGFVDLELIQDGTPRRGK